MTMNFLSASPAKKTINIFSLFSPFSQGHHTPFTLLYKRLSLVHSFSCTRTDLSACTSYTYSLKKEAGSCDSFTVCFFFLYFTKQKDCDIFAVCNSYLFFYSGINFSFEEWCKLKWKNMLCNIFLFNP